MIRATNLGLALAQAALKVKNPVGTIANQVLWRADNTTAGVVKEIDYNRVSYDQTKTEARYRRMFGE